MQLKEGMSVFTRSGEEIGRINRFVLDPATNEVTHIVIQKGWLLPEDKVVSFQTIDSGAEDQVVLNEDIKFDELPSFEETYFVRADDDPNQPRPAGDLVYPYAPAYYWYPARPGFADAAVGPGFYPIPVTGAETRRNIPEDTVPLKEGTDVISSDGEHVGDVEQLIVEPNSNQATHFVISQGLLFKDRKLVPAHWVKSVAEDEVRLVVSTRLLERLPSYES
jgi:uncharacterized protein YrrD